MDQMLAGLSQIIAANEFWQAFWPNFASTVLGLILGLPLALLANRIVMSSSQRLKEQEEERQLTVAMQLIAQTLKANQRRLDALIERLHAGLVPFDTRLDISAWDAVKPEVMGHLRDPVLQGRIAYHFAQLSSIDKLTDLYLHYAAGIAAALGGSEKTRDALRTYLLQLAAILKNDADGIGTLIAVATSQPDTPDFTSLGRRLHSAVHRSKVILLELRSAWERKKRV